MLILCKMKRVVEYELEMHKILMRSHQTGVFALGL